MNRIERMLQELCPNGVEYKKLGEVCEILDSKRKPVAKGKRTQGIYPYYGANGIQDYVDDYIFDGTFILLGEDGSVINTDKSPVLNWATGKIWVNNHAHILSEISSMANLRYLYFALQTKDVSGIVRGTPPKLNQENLRNIEIPVPPLPIQEEIVRILDHFTELTAELTAELQARQEQYEYYRNKLLTFDAGSVTWMKMSEIMDISRGASPRPISLYITESAEGVNWIKIGDVSPTSKYVTSTKEKITKAGAKKSKYLQKGDFILSNSMSFGRPYILKIDGCIHDGWISLSNFDKSVTSDYLYHILRTNAVQRYWKQNAGKGTVSNLNADIVRNTVIPIPPISEQKRIVSILNKFETLVNDLSQGLPAEIEAVQEQYEYYRNKLLMFNRIKSN